MPTFPRELFEAVQRGELTRDHTILLHPDDFNTLRLYVQREGLDPSFAVRPTLRGASIVSDPMIPRGLATIIDGQGRPDLPLNLRMLTALRAAKSEPKPPEPRTLWELLDEDE